MLAFTLYLQGISAYSTYVLQGGSCGSPHIGHMGWRINVSPAELILTAGLDFQPHGFSQKDVDVQLSVPSRNARQSRSIKHNRKRQMSTSTNGMAASLFLPGYGCG